jgi:hypothetical protein
MTSHIRRTAVLVGAAAAIGLIAAGVASANGNYLYLRGDSGDYLAGTHTYWLTDANATFNAHYGCDGCAATRATTMMASVDSRDGVDWWNVWLSPLLGQPLVPGTYTNAQRSDFRDSTHPGMDVFGDGRGCNTVLGDFTTDIASFSSHTVTQFHATFTDHCEGGAAALHGDIGINVPLPPAPPTGTVLIDNGAPATNSTSATLSISGSRISEFRYSTDGTLDSEPWQPYVSKPPVTLPAGDGVKSVVAQFRNSVGFVSDPTADSILLDTAPPTGARFTSPSSCCAAVATVNPFRVGWTATDTGSGVASYVLSYTSAPYDGDFGVSTPWVSTNSTHKSFTGSPGTQYCFTVQAKDKADNVSAPGKGCFVLPIDDATLTDASASWTRATSAPYYYLSTYSRSNADGATLESPTLQAKRIGILYTRCPACGTVAVSFNGVELGSIDTHSKSATKTMQLTYFPRFNSVLEGTVQIRSGGANPVYVDGLVFSRS